MRRITLNKWFGLCTTLVFLVALAACGDDEVGGSDATENQPHQSDQQNHQTENHDGDPEPCVDHDQCEAPAICVFDDPGQQGLCLEPEDTLPDGDECTASAQCDSGLCLDSVCTRECDEDTDCLDGWFCRDRGDHAICEDPTPCDARRDCSDHDDRCVVERDDDLRVICRPPVGDAELGEACSDDGECASRLCHDGQCSQPCANPSDCGDGDDYLCTAEALLDDQTVTICTHRPADACLSDADCDDPQRCVATTDEEALRFACGAPNDGGGEGGDLCTEDADCAQNLCVDGACAAPCHGDDACTAIPASSCTSITVERDDTQGTVSVCEVPVLCDHIAHCSADQTCYIQVDDDAVHTLCDTPNASNRGPGQACSNHLQCASNYCHQGRFGNYCTTPCTVDSHCPDVVGDYAMECGDLSIDYADGSGSETIFACLHQDPTPCVDDSQCDADQACAVVVNDTQDGLAGACLPDTGGAQPGDSCSTHSQCANHLCLNGTCSAPCVGDDVCGDFQQCNEATIAKDGQSDDLDVCTDPISTPCDAPVDCGHQNMTCNSIATDNAGNIDGAACGLINLGQAELGQLCADRSECESDYCWASDDGVNGECTVFCEDSARDCADTQVCTGLSDGLAACLRTCDATADCVGGNVCQVGFAPDDTGVHGICDQLVGAGQTGDECTDGSECETGLCLTVSTYEVTATICDFDSDCDSGFECRCPPSDSNCLNEVCVSVDAVEEKTSCTEMCNAANGNADCADGHDMTECRDDINYSWDGGSDTISLCSFPNAE